MTMPTHVTLRAGERIFINGAVLRSDGRATFEILNDVPYLLEHEIMHPQQTVTPLRQLYYILQTMVTDPASVPAVRELYAETMDALEETFENGEVLAGLKTIRRQVEEESPFAALKTLRMLVPIEDQILGRNRLAELRVVEAG